MIRYRKIVDYKYLLRGGGKAYMTPIKPDKPLYSPNEKDWMIALDPSGMLTIKQGYMWDGASGPTVDGSTNMEPALKHDCFYQLMSEGTLSLKWRKAVDRLFYRDLKVAGMNPVRAWYYHKAVAWFGHRAAAIRDNKYKVYQV